MQFDETPTLRTNMGVNLQQTLLIERDNDPNPLEYSNQDLHIHHSQGRSPKKWGKK